MSPMGRRTFLGGLAAGAAGALARGSFAADPNGRIVVGVMGLGRGASLARTFSDQPNTVVKYVCDVDRERAAPIVKSLEAATGTAPEIVTDFRQMLDAKDLDALICAAPNHWHAPASILACAAGKHVYVEKPCCHNPREGEWMVQAARAANRAVQMGAQRRSSPGTKAAIGRLKEGAVGRIYLVKAWYNSARDAVGKGEPAPVPPSLDYELWQGPAPRRPYLTNRIHYNWHWFWHWGNGELGNNGVHTLDLCRWGAGVDYPIRVVSSGGRYAFEDEQETPDTHSVAFEFPGKVQITWDGLSCHRRSSGFVTFYGDGGALALESNGAYAIFDSQEKEIERRPGDTVGDKEHAANFLDAIRTDRPLSLNTEILEGYKSTLLCHLGNIAHRTGRTLECDPANGMIKHDAEAMAYWGRPYERGWEPKV
ncbi:MAG: Gfo/Idh/MocA family oxidoreductase [Planctomycetes bacterium]|nr:Gfo/Idh/MocA family oxidoreductase [Planctomycetota bacterium]